MLSKIVFFWIFFVSFAYAQQDSDDFFGFTNKSTHAQNSDTKEKKLLDNEIPQTDQSEIQINNLPSPKLISLNEIVVRVNNSMLTQRELSIYFALKPLSRFLVHLNTIDEARLVMTYILGLETYIRSHSLSNLFPSRTEIDKRIRALNNNLGTKNLEESIAKIDKTNTLTSAEIRKFFYYQILYDKGFVFFLQRDFSQKIFTPREDEIQNTYHQLIQKTPTTFNTPSQLMILNIVALSPSNDSKRENLIDKMMSLKSRIMKVNNMHQKLSLFKEGINQLSDKRYKTLKVIGPLDESLIIEDFPEYKELFLLEKGQVSSIIEKNGLIRMIFIVKKTGNELRSLEDPEIRSRIKNILYEKKTQVFFQQFLRKNLAHMNVVYQH